MLAAGVQLLLASLAAIVVVGLAMAGAVWVLRRHRRCPSCNAALVPVESGERPDRTWQALACPRCTTAVTLAHGTRGRFAWCPACRQRSMEVPCLRLPDEDGHPVVEVHERCTLCGYAREVVVGRHSGAAPRGLVLPFPSAEEASRRARSDRGSG